MERTGRRKDKGGGKGMETCFVHAPAPHKELHVCKHGVLGKGRSSVAPHLPGMHKAPSSIPSTNKDYKQGPRKNKE